MSTPATIYEELAEARGQRDRARKALVVLLDAFDDHNRHASGCGCDKCEAIYAARKELGR